MMSISKPWAGTVLVFGVLAVAGCSAPIALPASPPTATTLTTKTTAAVGQHSRAGSDKSQMTMTASSRTPAATSSVEQVKNVGGAVATAAAKQAGNIQAAGATPQDGALAWARSQLGSPEDNGYCLQFVFDAYQSTGVDIGAAPTAVDWWNAHASGQHPGDTTPPAGALVFWNQTPTNGAGHVGIAEGGDTVISTYEESNSNVHEFSIASRNSAGFPYLGWIMPV